MRQITKKNAELLDKGLKNFAEEKPYCDICKQYFMVASANDKRRRYFLEYLRKADAEAGEHKRND